jgi:hypothetical protein
MTTRVVHCKREKFDVYIGRPSRWGNPYTFKKGTIAEFVVPKDEVIPRYEAWLKQQPELMASLHELKGKTLGCWCKPAACHGDILARLADETTHEGY